MLLRPLEWTFVLSSVHIKNVEVWTCCVKYFGPGWTGVLENTTFIWSKRDKHAKCIYYFLNSVSQIKTRTWCFQIFSLWSWDMQWAFTRSSETVKQPVLFYALVWFSHARGPHTLIRRGKSPFTLAPDFSFQLGFLIYFKRKGWFTSEKVLFLWSTIYPANFDTFNGLLELVPSGISPFLVFFWPSMRRYRIEHFALYAVLATK